MRDFYAWTDDLGVDDARRVAAHDPGDAAERFAEQDDYRSCDYTFAKGSDEVVYVRDESGAVHRFTIYSETRPTYRAVRVKGGSDGE